MLKIIILLAFLFCTFAQPIEQKVTRDISFESHELKTSGECLASRYHGPYRQRGDFYPGRGYQDRYYSTERRYYPERGFGKIPIGGVIESQINGVLLGR
ncbi:hypothetical protein PVAND_014520 [Polypedilum vanderplanki]|uniref:Secreted protein n=1 Tax=Polypedilum vanderplanki TaxID=319348 RepID=A0A9J6BA84_POLVA|nr:hypothetical protein PVAND_014520 [Polypedilum vanderplanki]